MTHLIRLTAIGLIAVQGAGSGIALAADGAKAAYLNAFGQTQVTAGGSNVRVQDVAVAPVAPVATSTQAPVAVQAGSTPTGVVMPVSVQTTTRPATATAGSGGYTGMSFWVEVTTKDQRTIPATTDRVFQSGETVRLHFKPNATGYLYVFNKGSTGRTRLLYPAQGEDNAVKAGSVVTVPGPGNVMRFDSNPGQEQLVAVMSRVPLRDQIPAMVTASTGSPATTSPGSRLQVAELDTSRFETDLSRVRSKDIVLERDSKPRDGMQPATYAVAPRGELEQGRIITVNITLQHK